MEYVKGRIRSREEKMPRMITEYIQAALDEAEYEVMENGEVFAGVPSLPGASASRPTFEATREELYDVVEGYIIVSLRFGDPLPEIGGVGLDARVPH